MGKKKKSNRRDFIKNAIGGAATVGLGVQAPLVYGTPASKEPDVFQNVERLVLDVARLDIDREIVTDVVELSKLTDEIITDNSNRKAFFSNPSKYLKKRGYTKNLIVDDSLEAKSLAIYTRADIQSALKDGDFRYFFDQLKLIGIIDNISVSSTISGKIRSLIKRDSKFKQVIKNQVEALIDGKGYLINENAILNAVETYDDAEPLPDDDEGDEDGPSTPEAVNVEAIGNVIAVVNIFITVSIVSLVGVVVGIAVFSSPYSRFQLTRIDPKLLKAVSQATNIAQRYEPDETLKNVRRFLIEEEVEGMFLVIDEVFLQPMFASEDQRILVKDELLAGLEKAYSMI